MLSYEIPTKRLCINGWTSVPKIISVLFIYLLKTANLFFFFGWNLQSCTSLTFILLKEDGDLSYAGFNDVRYCGTGCTRVQRDIWKLSCWWKSPKGRFRLPKSEVPISFQGIHLAEADLVPCQLEKVLFHFHVSVIIVDLKSTSIY